MRNIYDSLDLAQKIYTKALYSSVLEDVANGESRNAIIQRLMTFDKFKHEDAKTLFELIYSRQSEIKKMILQIELDIRKEERNAIEEEEVFSNPTPASTAVTTHHPHVDGHLVVHLALHLLKHFLGG